MPFTKHKIHHFILQCADGTVACIAFMLAFYLRSNVGPTVSPVNLTDIGTLKDYVYWLPSIAFLAPLILTRLGFYNLGANQHKGLVLNICLQASLLLFLLLVVLLFIFKDQQSRLVFMIFVPICTIFLFLRHVLYLAERRLSYRRKERRKNILLVTDQNGSTGWWKDLENHPEFGLHPAGEVNLATTSKEKFVQTLHNEAIEFVILDVKYSSFEKVVETVKACENEGIEIWLATGLFDTRVAHAKVGYFLDRPVLIFSSTPDNSWEILCKELLDRAGALALLLVFSLPMLLIAAVIKFGGKGPVLFRQQRSGHYGKPFVMHKFRSMVTNAEQLQDELQRLNEMSGPVFKVSKDPRITPFGAWLRKTSLDELPQLFNVLKGEMSLVGPRPLPVYETKAISENAQRRRLSVKPGLTCLWQIRGRNHVTSFEDWVNMDLEYIDNWSIWLDFQILFMTIPAVLFSRGAK